MADAREHVLATSFGVSVHDDERCWCSDDEDTAAMRRPDLAYLLEAARVRNRARNLAVQPPTDPHPTEKDSR